jgi:hypothetical protein
MSIKIQPDYISGKKKIFQHQEKPWKVCKNFINFPSVLHDFLLDYSAVKVKKLK